MRYHRQRPKSDVFVHHSAKGFSYASIRYTDRQALEDLESSVGGIGGRHDNAPAETSNTR